MLFRFRSATLLTACALCLSALVLAGCATTNAKTDYDPAADFSKFHTYVWAGGKDMATQGMLENSLVDKRVKAIITAQLNAKGLTEVPLGQPSDLVVRYWVAVKDKQQIDTVPGGVGYGGYGGYGPYWGGHWGMTYDQVVVSNYKEGTLIVDLIDAKSKDLAWRAYLVQTLQSDMRKTEEQATRNAAAAFQNYPPRKEGM